MSETERRRARKLSLLAPWALALPLRTRTKRQAGECQLLADRDEECMSFMIRGFGKGYELNGGVFFKMAEGSWRRTAFS